MQQQIGIPENSTISETYQLPQITAEYEGETYNWLCTGYTVRITSADSDTWYDWTPAQLAGTAQTWDFSEAKGNYVYVHYRWVREDRLQANVDANYETVDITYHVWDHILESGTYGTSSLKIPSDCDFSNPTAELYGSDNSYYNKFGQENRAASPAFFPSRA